MKGSRTVTPEAGLYDAMLWGAVGGIGYAGTRFSATLWAGEEVSERARRLATAQFVIAVFLAPFAGHAITPVIIGKMPWLTLPATAFLVGLGFNAIWPVLVERDFLRQLLADVARGMANRLSPRGDE